MRYVAEVSSFNLMYNLCMYYEKQKSYDKTELTFQPTLVYIIYVYLLLIKAPNIRCSTSPPPHTHTHTLSPFIVDTMGLSMVRSKAMPDVA